MSNPSLLGYNPKLLVLILLVIVAVAARLFLSFAITIIVPAVHSIVIKLVTICAVQFLRPLTFFGRFCNMIDDTLFTGIVLGST